MAEPSPHFPTPPDWSSAGVIAAGDGAYTPRAAPREDDDENLVPIGGDENAVPLPAP